MTLIDGQSGSAPAGKCGFLSRKHPVCPAPASAATGAPSHSLVAAIPSIVRIAFDGTTVAIAGVIEGQRSFLFCCSDLSPSSTFLGSVNKRMSGSEAGLRPATSISGGHRMVFRKIGNPRAEKAGACRSRQTMASEPDACAGVGSPRQGTLTIIGSNVRLGTEMPVALSSFCK